MNILFRTGRHENIGAATVVGVSAGRTVKFQSDPHPGGLPRHGRGQRDRFVQFYAGRFPYDFHKTNVVHIKRTRGLIVWCNTYAEYNAVVNLSPRRHMSDTRYNALAWPNSKVESDTSNVFLRKYFRYSHLPSGTIRRSSARSWRHAFYGIIQIEIL